ncbi:helix-turn-helix domain-containing protein [Streptomyces kronopolitis]
MVTGVLEDLDLPGGHERPEAGGVVGSHRVGPPGGRLGVAGGGRQRGTESECGRGDARSGYVTHTHDVFPSGQFSGEVWAGLWWLTFSTGTSYAESSCALEVQGIVIQITWTIGQLAARTGLPVKTVRYYSDIGLLPVAERSAGGHRRYRPEALEQLHLVQRLRALDTPISTITQLASGARSLGDLITDEMGLVRSRLAELHWRQATLEALDNCSAQERLRRLEVLSRVQRLPDAQDRLAGAWGQTIPELLPSLRPLPWRGRHTRLPHLHGCAAARHHPPLSPLLATRRNDHGRSAPQSGDHALLAGRSPRFAATSRAGTGAMTPSRRRAPRRRRESTTPTDRG